jgi:hypothetical protein
MKKQINFVAVMMFVIALASLVATVKLGHPGKGGFGGYGFSNGG